VLPATALTGKYASPLLRAVPFKAPVPTQRVALAWRRGFHRPRAVALPAELLRGLPLPNAAGADDMSNARGRHAGG
jgi:LysR family hydrogen peroxide-inducible transcriptional activator